MDVRKTSHLNKRVDVWEQAAAELPDLEPQPDPDPGPDPDPEKQNRTSEDQRPLLIHGLSVDRYRSIYSSVLQPSVLSGLSKAKNTDYVSQVLELKQRLWTTLSRPRLEETLMEDGRVEVKEILDLT